MSALRRSKSGSYFARKGIPKDVRAEYKRRYRAGWEAKFFLPAKTPLPEAKARHQEWLAEVETQIAALRAAARGGGQSLSQRQAYALAGEWYLWFVSRHEENPGTPEHWQIAWDNLISLIEEGIPYWAQGETYRHLDRLIRDPEVLAGVRWPLADDAKTAQFLASKGVVLNRPGMELFLDYVVAEYMAAILRLERMAKGYYEPEDLSLFPKFDGPKVTRPAPQNSPWQLFEAWVKAREPAPSLVDRWRGVFLDLEKHFESKGAWDISEDDARQWSRTLVTAERKARTVNDVWLSAAKTVFSWALKERLIDDNPFKGVRVTEPRRIQHRETKAFDEKEWSTILRAALAVQNPASTFQGALRWVPWLCAYTGARAGEVTQLRAKDIERRGQIAILKITPDAGTVKTNKPRSVPIHEHLIEQGFLDFVRSRGSGPLFYNPKGEETADDPLNPKRPRSVSTRQRLAAWVRKLGITDKELSPNHAWRHTFKARAHRVGIGERMSDYITGHSQRTEGAKYGAPTVEDMAEELAKFPRYDLG
jgi:integrase